MKKIILLLCFSTGQLFAQSAPLDYAEALKKMDRFLWIVPSLLKDEKVETYQEAFAKYCKDPKDCMLKDGLVYRVEKIVYASPDAKEPSGYFVRYKPQDGYQVDSFFKHPFRDMKHGSYLITTSFKNEDTYSDFPGKRFALNNYPIIYEIKKEKDFIWVRLTDLPSKKSVWLKLDLKNLDGNFFEVDNRFSITGLYPVNPEASEDELKKNYFNVGYDCFYRGKEVKITNLKNEVVNYNPTALAILTVKISEGDIYFVAFSHPYSSQVKSLAQQINKSEKILKIPLDSLVNEDGLTLCMAY